jgi:hypothetical protein
MERIAASCIAVTSVDERDAFPFLVIRRPRHLQMAFRQRNGGN